MPTGDGFVRPLSDAEVEAGQRKAAAAMGIDYDELIPPAIRARMSGTPITPPVGAPFKNFGAVDRLTEGVYFEYRGILFRVRPFHAKWGWRLQVLQREYLDHVGKEATTETMVEMLRLLTAMTKLWRKLAKPVSALHRSVYWLQRGPLSPFGDPTEDDLFRLNAFFFTCQTKSSAREWTPQARLAPPLRESIWQRTTR